MSNPLVIRRNDFSLTDDDEAVSSAFAAYFSDNCPLSRVRANEPLGFDRDLWAALCGLGAVSMAVEAARGGDGGTLVQAALIAELCGAHAAPVPFAESVAVARLLSRTTVADDALLRDVLDGRRVVGLASRSLDAGWPQLVGSGAVADAVVGMAGAEMVLLEKGTWEPRHLATQGWLPLARWDPSECAVTCLSRGDEARSLFDRACSEYKVLTASALAGLGSESIALAARFASERMTRGVPIGALQGISHPLVDAKIRIEGVRQTARKAAWFCEFDPEGDPKLPRVAFVAAARAADEAVRVAVHTHGGIGVMVDGDPAVYFLRAMSWASAVAGVFDELAALAEVLRTPRYLHAVYPSML